MANIAHFKIKPGELKQTSPGECVLRKIARANHSDLFFNNTSVFQTNSQNYLRIYLDKNPQFYESN